MTHRFLFRTEHAEVVCFAVDPDNIAACKASDRSALLWQLDKSMNEETPLLHPSKLPRYHAWTTEVLACAVSKVKRRLYVKAKK
jgi:hypothetical protein